MRTETKIGIVVGLAVVVVASVYFFRSPDDDSDLIVQLTPAVTSEKLAIPSPIDGAAGAKSAQRADRSATERTAGGAAPGTPSPAVPRPYLASPRPTPAPITRTPSRPGSTPALASTERTTPSGASSPSGRVALPPAVTGQLPGTPLRTSASDALRDATRPEPTPGDSPPTLSRTAGPAIGALTPPDAVTTITRGALSPAGDSGVASGTPGASWPRTYVVRSGDTLYRIASEAYGDAAKIELIRRANTALSDPRRMRVGMKLTLPDPSDASAGRTTAVSPPAAPSPRGVVADGGGSNRTYIVRSGDSLSSIADAQLGQSGRWRELLQLNRRLLQNDPRRLQPGMTLILPSGP